MLHGYTGSRNEIPVAGGEDMFARTARAFAERGMATLRIDFLGSGQSDGDWADTRFSGQARDAIFVAGWLRAEYGGEYGVNLPLGVLGYSQGRPRSAPRSGLGRAVRPARAMEPVMDPLATYGTIFGRETILDGDKLAKLIGTPRCPTPLDVRLEEARAAAARLVRQARSLGVAQIQPVPSRAEWPAKRRSARCLG